MVKSKPAKQEVSHTVILPPMVSVLCLLLRKLAVAMLADESISQTCASNEAPANYSPINHIVLFLKHT